MANLFLTSSTLTSISLAQECERDIQEGFQKQYLDHSTRRGIILDLILGNDPDQVTGVG